MTVSATIRPVRRDHVFFMGAGFVAFAGALLVVVHDVPLMGMFLASPIWGHLGTWLVS